MRRMLLVAAWVVVAVLGLLTLLRWTGLDAHSSILIAASTGAPVVLLPSWATAATGFLLRERWLALVSIALIIVELLVLAPLVAGGRGLTRAERSPGATSLRVLALNVEYDHHTGPAVTRQVLAAHPDIVVLSELSTTSMQGLDLSSYPYSFISSQHRGFGSGIWSRWPLENGAVRNFADAPMSTAIVDLPSGQHLQLLQIHTNSPTSARGRRLWKEELVDLRRLLHAAGGLTIVAGDFNASRTDRGFARLLDGPGDFADAADGRGLLPTWPSGKALVPPVLRLDHVLVSRNVGVKGVRVLGPVGSDHRAVVVDLRVGQ